MAARPAISPQSPVSGKNIITDRAANAEFQRLAHAERPGQVAGVVICGKAEWGAVCEPHRPD